ncbi:ABC transporter substrate-binding protein [Agrobacterium tumefaciens]|uniref:ABC transporter substrate-binding protein n=1 Tax=Agrobacterium tumefaciens TaxID=358 RepID=UPI00157467A3|nr:ABC transporter substrate-binding protein [Agrobacterium tumefaciens]
MHVTPTREAGRLKSAAVAAVLTLTTALTGFASAAFAKTLVAVPHSGLRILDPVITTAHIVRNHGYMVWDTLLSYDAELKVHPQMADYSISDDKMVYTFTLRDGLKWHDGTLVTAEDCVVSLQRWGKRDTSGQVMFDRTESLTATDEKTIVLMLKTPFPYVLDVLAKPSSIVPFMMPKRVAETPADTAITEIIGSGPFKFVQSEYQPGVKAVYEKFTDYVPRPEAANGLAGGKVVKVDRVEWVSMPDAQTAINAIQSGEIDYLEAPPVDLLPLVESNEELTVKKLQLGTQTMGRMNFLYPPFDNKKIRQAAMMAMSQKDVLDALIGNPDYYTICGSLFGCGTPLETEAGAEALTKGNGLDKAKALLKEAGYDGTPVVLMQPTDVVTIKGQPVVAAAALRAAGFNVDMQAMDWQTLVTRRASQKPPAEGGWNLFFTNWIVPEVMTPLNNPMLNGRGTQGFFGWPTDPKLEELRVKYIEAQSPEAQKVAATELQVHAMDEVNYVPLGQFNTPSVWRNELSGLLVSPIPIFWNIEKTEE